MQDTSLQSDQDDSQDSGAKVYVKVASLATDDGTQPEVGDEVELSSVKGTVQSIDGDVACVSPTEINGDPAPEAPKTPSDDEEEASLRDQFDKSKGFSSSGMLRTEGANANGPI